MHQMSSQGDSNWSFGSQDSWNLPSSASSTHNG